MARKPHKVAFLGQRPLPGVVLCVQCTRKLTFGGDADEYGSEIVNYWACAVLKVSEHATKLGSVAEGVTPDAFWSMLHRAGRDSPETTIVSCGAREHMAAMGLWDLLLDGTYAVTGWDTAAKDARQGTVILEAPPTIVQFQSAADKRQYTWIDPLNFLSHVGDNTCVDFDCTAAECKQIAIHVRDWYVSLLSALHMLKLGNPEHTAGSQAAAGYRKSYMNHTIVVHDNEQVLKLERSALYGGRNECRFIGTVFAQETSYNSSWDTAESPNVQAGMFDESPTLSELSQECPRGVITQAGSIYQLDFNSLYPAVASSALLPVKLRGVLRSPAVSTLLEACRAMPVIATVRVNTETPCVPVWIDPKASEPRSITRLVVADGINEYPHRMIFPRGNFLAALCGPEILLAAEHGEIVSCGFMACYEGRPIYRKWVEMLFAARRAWEKGDVCDISSAIKAIMNASFSKWAAWKREWQDRPDELCPWPWDQFWRHNEETDELEQWRCFAWHVQRLRIIGEPGDSCPAITAYINSLARVKLWQAIEACDPGRVFYCDTDSVWTDQVGFEQLGAAGMLDAQELGKLKVAGTYSSVELFGLKRYFADGKLTCAGGDGETVRTSDAWALAMRPTPAHAFLRKHRPPGIERSVARMRLNMPYRHGIVANDGWVQPLSITDR